MLEDREYNGGFVKFVNNVTTTMLDEQMTKIKVVDLRKLNTIPQPKLASN
jgi:hypothetical protein